MKPLQSLLAHEITAVTEEDDLDVDFRPDYSGRGMYGRTCVGITGTKRECQVIVSRVISALREELKTVQLGSSEEECDRVFDEAVGILLNYEHDSMGMGGVILYWPQLETLPEEQMQDDMAEYDGQPDEAQEWHDFDPDC